MKTFKKLGLLTKVLLRVLPFNDFSMLLNLAEQSFVTAPKSKDNKTARRLLKIYFKKPLDTNEMELLADRYYMVAQNIWLETAKKRSLSEFELNYLVKRFPWNQFRHFPLELPKANLTDLFDERNPYKLISYCRDYTLPEDFELLLIDRYNQNLIQTDEKMQFHQLVGDVADGWEKALMAYLEGGNCSDNRFASSKVQEYILDLRNSEMTKKLVARWDITMNRMTYKSVEFLIDNDCAQLVQILLRDSYLDNDFEKLLNAKAPHLKTQYYIAALRRRMYLEGPKSQNYWRAVMLNKYEQMIVRLHKEMGPLSDRDEFIDSYIKPSMGLFGPCMCAYLAYHFPDLENDLYESLRNRY